MIQKKILLFTCILLLHFSYAQTVFQTKWLKFSINKQGYIISIKEKSSQKEYFPDKQKSALLSLYADSTYIYPSDAKWNVKKNELELSYPNHSKAKIKVISSENYLKFVLSSLENRSNIQCIVWGPVATTINKKIGETVCVVRDDSFALGMQGLNTNVTEGIPDNLYEMASFIDPLPGQTLPDSLKNSIGKRINVNVNETGDMPDYVRMYRGLAAVKKSFGSELRLYSRDRRKGRLTKNEWDNTPLYIEPVNVDFIGSAIALFGCPENKTLDVIEDIELKEGLPHPMYQGVWIKKNPIVKEPVLVYTGTNLDKCIEIAKKGNFKTAKIGEIFNSWGHFGVVSKQFPEGEKSIKAFTDKAKKEGIGIGIHTLTLFTQTNDQYISPVPSDSLLKSGNTVLTKSITDTDKTIFIKDPFYFIHPDQTHTIKIDKELISYRAVSKEAPWRLLDCVRGQFKTNISQHKEGAIVDKLMNDSYRGFYPDANLMPAYAKRLAQVCNQSGLSLIDFDGYPNWFGGDAFNDAQFIDTWYKSLDNYALNCAAGTFHYFWHIYSFMNWGEPWYNQLRESQVNYRIENQRYFDRNLMPGMLGWFSVGADYRPEEMEWIQARSAGFDAGYMLCMDESLEKSGFYEQLYNAINDWQTLRRAKAFSKEQIALLQNPKNEFHLQKTADHQWKLYPVSFQRGYVHKYRATQTGEPVVNTFKINNPYYKQPVQFYISVNGNEGSINNLTISVNDFQTISINETLKKGDRIYCDGKTIYLCDKYWKSLKILENDNIPFFENAENTVAVKSDFSEADSPVLSIDFRLMGAGQAVNDIK